MHGMVVLIWQFDWLPLRIPCERMGRSEPGPGRDLICTGTYCSKPVHLNLRLVHYRNSNGDNGDNGNAQRGVRSQAAKNLLLFASICSRLLLFAPVCSVFASFVADWLGMLCSFDRGCLAMLAASKLVWKAPKHRVTLAIVANLSSQQVLDPDPHPAAQFPP